MTNHFEFDSTNLKNELNNSDQEASCIPFEMKFIKSY